MGGPFSPFQQSKQQGALRANVKIVGKILRRVVVPVKKRWCGDKGRQAGSHDNSHSFPQKKERKHLCVLSVGGGGGRGEAIYPCCNATLSFVQCCHAAMRFSSSFQAYSSSRARACQLSTGPRGGTVPSKVSTLVHARSLFVCERRAHCEGQRTQYSSIS